MGRAGQSWQPDDAWRQLHAVAVLCGIGFTMSLFLDSTADLQGLERLGILLGTLVSGVLGYLARRAALGRQSAES